jgi:very-short-patch-repair endonuclease
MTKRARALRSNATDAERRIWLRIRSYRPRFTRQLVIGNYIIDLACREAKLAIELDGSQHTDSPHDQERTAFLESLGWRVLRFWNSEVITNPDGVAVAILAEVGRRLGPTHPQPLPSREGSKKGE